MYMCGQGLLISVCPEADMNFCHCKLVVTQMENMIAVSELFLSNLLQQY